MLKRLRFYLNGERYVVDRLDWLNNGLAMMPEELAHSVDDMRREVLWKRLDKLFECLVSPYIQKKYGLYKPRTITPLIAQRRKQISVAVIAPAPVR
jgi:hypothetical protein